MARRSATDKEADQRPEVSSGPAMADREPLSGVSDLSGEAGALSRRWLETSCRALRQLMSAATYVRQARGAGLTDEEAELSGEHARDEVAAIAKEVEEVEAQARARHVTLPVDYLSEHSHLDVLDRRILLLAVAPHVDVGMRDAIARFNDNLLQNYVDVRLCLEFLVVDPVERLAARRRFRADAPLVRSRIIEVGRPRDGSTDNLLNYDVMPSSRVLAMLLGELGTIDPNLAAVASLEIPEVTLDDVVIDPDTIAPLLSLLDRRARKPQPRLPHSPFTLSSGLCIEVSGPPGIGKTLLVRALCHHVGRNVIEVDANKVAALDGQLFEDTLGAILEEASLTGAVVCLDKADALLAKGGPKVGPLQDALIAHSGVTFITSHDSESLDPNVNRFVVHRTILDTPPANARKEIYVKHVPADVRLADECDLDTIAGTYQFPGALIRNAVLVATSRARALDDPIITTDMLRKASHEQVRASLDEFSVKRKPNLSLKDLILPADELHDVDEMFTAAKQRSFVLHHWGFGKKLTTGKGMVALFSGEPGTGKTLCAEILGREMDMELYQIAIPRVVSKWIGETEQNIEKIFQTARSNHAILLFDEADALFTSRTKVESSVDRYANMATNMLLQEIERFEGVVLLTTNLEKNIDKAFQRRINFKIHFPFPEPAYRARIWKALVPKECPVDPHVDWDLLGKAFELAGGNIKNAILRAAYQAAADGKPLNMRHFEYAARQECKNAGKVFRAIDWEDPDEV